MSVVTGEFGIPARAVQTVRVTIEELERLAPACDCWTHTEEEWAAAKEAIVVEAAELWKQGYEAGREAATKQASQRARRR